MMTHRRWVVWPVWSGLLLLMLLLLPAAMHQAEAQSSRGQICIRAFEDRNGNSEQDPGEPLLTRGISATLQDVDGVIVDSRLMEDSPNAAQGTLCFQRLEAGQYTVRISSASYEPTTQREFVTAVSETGEPVVFSYGAQLIQVTAPAAGTDSGNRFDLSSDEQRTLLGRLLLSGLGAVVAIAVMGVIGVIIYVLFFRNTGDSDDPVPDRAAYRRSPANAAPPQTDFPGNEPPIRADDTGPVQTIGTDTDVPTDSGSTSDSSNNNDDSDDPNAPFRPPQS